jgi:hypothetical protein
MRQKAAIDRTVGYQLHISYQSIINLFFSYPRYKSVRSRTYHRAPDLFLA